MRAKDKARGFGFVVWVAVADGAEGAVLMDCSDVRKIFLVIEFGALRGGVGEGCAICFHFVKCFVGDWIGSWRARYRRIGDVEGILKVAGRVLLWYEKSIEVPEARIDEPIHTLALKALGGELERW